VRFAEMKFYSEFKSNGDFLLTSVKRNISDSSKKIMSGAEGDIICSFNINPQDGISWLKQF